MVFDAARVGQNCEFCGSPALVAYTEIKAPIRPREPAPVQDSAPIASATTCAAGCEPLARAEPAQRARRSSTPCTSLYIPYWTFDANVRCPWEAEAGYYYYVSVSAPRQPGSHRHAPGTARPLGAGVRRDRARRSTTSRCRRRMASTIGSAATGRAVPDRGTACPYDTAFLSGHVVEHYQVVLFDAAGASQQPDARQELERLCAVAGARRHLPQPARSIRTTRTRRSSTSSCRSGCSRYTYGPKNFQVVANGYTGMIAGRYPYSAWKIFFLIVTIAIVLFVLLYAAG